MRITEEEIKRISSGTVYQRGIEYFREGRVHIRKRDDKEIVALVDDEKVYDVIVNFDDESKVVDSFCSCAYFSTMNCTCKHIVACLKVRQKEIEEGGEYLDENDKIAKELCQCYNKEDNQKVKLNLSLKLYIDTQDSKKPKYAMQLAIGTNSMQPVNAVESFLLAWAGDEEYKISKFRTFSHERYEFSENDAKILDILSENCQNKAEDGFYKKRLAMTQFSQMTAKRLMPLLEKAHVDIYVDDLHLNNMQIKNEDPYIPADITAYESTISLFVPENGIALFSDGSWFLYGGDIYKTSPEWRKKYMPLYTTLHHTLRTRVDFTGENSVLFVKNVLPCIKEGKAVCLEGVKDIVVDKEAEFEVYFEADNDTIRAVVTVNYGGIRLILPEKSSDFGGKIVVRDRAREEKVLRFFNSFDLEKSSFIKKDSDEIYKFVRKDLPELEKLAKITASTQFNELRKKEDLKLDFTIKYLEKSDLLEVDFESDLSKEELKQILSCIKLKKNYFKAQNGRYYNIDSSNNSIQLLEHINITKEDIKEKKKVIDKYHALYLGALAQKGYIKMDKSFDEFIDRLNSLKADVPKDINKHLREYQKEAVNWMLKVKTLGFGGILADDMGLGKTLEVIAFVMSSEEKGQSLVVVPSALLYNWEKEINRFAPNAKVIIIDSGKTNREEKLKNIKDYDFVITSYSLLRRDISMYKDLEFLYCFADEAQYIKNPKTMNAKAIKKINALNRFALTGTPIENSLCEIWSIFDFIMPGYFKSLKSFTANYEKPIMQGFEEPMTALKLKIMPFMMRRMKKDVLEELPDKIEEIIYAPLNSDQKNLYTAFLDSAREDAINAINDKNTSAVMILSLLTRLRQICCHPALFDTSYKKGSAKLELLSQIVTSALDSGHRILIFSQFTSMLAIIKKTLEGNGINYFYMDGTTSSEERLDLCKRFNEGEKDVFLLSLKAGGTGLNLTGADTVIHYDPWWNPAVTQQASDRAHRIGQKRAVHVIRLVTSGAIEEKILKLQERKNLLADNLIIKNTPTFKDLTDDEIMELFEPVD